MNTYYYADTNHPVEVRVRTNQIQMLADAEQERLISLAKASETGITSTLPTWRRALGQGLINLGNRVVGKVKPTTA